MKKIIIDILMFILMLIEFSKVYLPPQIHEIVGICLLALVIAHLILNGKYIKAIPKGKYNLKRSSLLIINVAFMIVFFLTMIFGLLSSQEILTFLNIGSLTTVYLHKILAYICLILLGIHLGMNMNGLFRKVENKLPKTLTYFLYIIIVIFGIYSMLQVDFINHLTGNHGFSIVTGNILINTLEYLFIILMFSAIAHMILKIEK